MYTTLHTEFRTYFCDIKIWCMCLEVEERNGKTFYEHQIEGI